MTIGVTGATGRLARHVLARPTMPLRSAVAEALRGCAVAT